MTPVEPIVPYLPRAGRRRFQFSLRTMLIVMTLVAVWTGWTVSKAQRRQRAIAAIERLGGFIDYKHKWKDGEFRPNAEPPGPTWMRKILGERFAAEPLEIQLFADGRMRPIEFTDSEAAEISQFGELTWLVLMDTKLTDAGLRHFHRLKKLGRLDLERTAVTDVGVAELKRVLPDCRVFY